MHVVVLLIYLPLWLWNKDYYNNYVGSIEDVWFYDFRNPSSIDFDLKSYFKGFSYNTRRKKIMKIVISVYERVERSRVLTDLYVIACESAERCRCRELWDRDDSGVWRLLMSLRFQSQQQCPTDASPSRSAAYLHTASQPTNQLTRHHNIHHSFIHEYVWKSLLTI